jgi:hypothetical protein
MQGIKLQLLILIEEVIGSTCKEVARRLVLRIRHTDDNPWRVPLTRAPPVSFLSTFIPLPFTQCAAAVHGPGHTLSKAVSLGRSALSCSDCADPASRSSATLVGQAPSRAHRGLAYIEDIHV